MPRGVPNTKLVADATVGYVPPGLDQMAGAPPARATFNGEVNRAFDADEPAPAPPVKLIPVKLLRNYRPWVCVDEKIGKETKVTPFPAEHIVGYHRPAKMRKDAAGKPVEVEPAMFIKGELPPPSKFGVGFEGKIWAGAVIRVTKDEAAYVRKNGIGEIEIDDE